MLRLDFQIETDAHYIDCALGSRWPLRYRQLTPIDDKITRNIQILKGPFIATQLNSTELNSTV